eukprot:scaffold89688_cov27-Tisochrysis_lutea.AAC.2
MTDGTRNSPLSAPRPAQPIDGFVSASSSTSITRIDWGGQTRFSSGCKSDHISGLRIKKFDEHPTVTYPESLEPNGGRGATKTTGGAQPRLSHNPSPCVSSARTRKQEARGGAERQVRGEGKGQGRGYEVESLSHARGEKINN